MPLQRLIALCQVGHYAQALEEWKGLMVDLPGDDATLMAELHLWGGYIHVQTQQPYAAVTLIGIAERMAVRAENTPLLGRIRYQAGVIYRRIDDTTQAVEYLESFLRDLPKYPQLTHNAGAAHYTLGITYRQRHQLQESLHHYRKAITMLENPLHLVMALQNLAWVEFEAGECDAGDTRLAQADNLLLTLDAREQQLSQMIVRGYGNVLRGNYREPLALVNEILSPGSGATPEQQAWATWLMASCAYRLDHITEAEDMVAQAMRLAPKIADPRVIDYLAVLRRQITKLRQD